MWLNVFIPKEKHDYYDVREIARKMGLKWGVVSVKPVLRTGRVGTYTRLYDPTAMGTAIEHHQDKTGVELALNYPALPYDVDLFFRLVAEVCHRESSSVFYMDADPIPVADLQRVIGFYLHILGDVLTKIADEFDSGDREGYDIVGTRFPMVFGRREFSKIRSNPFEFAFLVDRLQRTKATYGDPEVYYLRDNRRVGCYTLESDTDYILPTDPGYFSLGQNRSVKEWVVDLGWGHVAYGDFIDQVDSTRFDESHRVYRVDDRTARDLCLRSGFDLFQEDSVRFSQWGLRLADMDGNEHADKVFEKNLDADPTNGYSHEAVFLRWCALHDLLSEELLEMYPDLQERLLSGKEDLRILVRDHEAFQGVIRRRHLNRRGRRFAHWFFRREESYPNCVDAYAEAYFGTEEYNDPKYQTEAYLFIPFDEEYEKGLFAYIDQAWSRIMEPETDE